MAYILAGNEIRRPTSISEANSTQVAAHRTLDGRISRDYFGNRKKVFELEYQNVQKEAFDLINGIYLNYLATGNTVAFESTENNYTVSSTQVHIDLLQRDFSVRGSSYISSFTLTLVEA